MLISRYDRARQAYWSQFNLPDSAQLLLEGSGPLGSGTGWAADGDPIPCRLSVIPTQGTTQEMALTLQHRLLWYLVLPRSVVVREEHRIDVTIQNDTAPARTIRVEVIQPRFRSSATEVRVLVRGPV